MISKSSTATLCRYAPHQYFLVVVIFFALALGNVQAQFAMKPLASFGSNGWLAPVGFNGSTYPYLTTNDTERGLAYGNNHLYLASRNGGDFIRVVDPLTGTDLGSLNLGTGVVSGGTFDVNMIAVGGDGAIYVGNLATGPAVFRVYRWGNDLSATTPTVVYNGVPLAGGRVGDSLAALGSGSDTILAAGFNNVPSVAGDNGYAIINVAAGSASAVSFAGSPPAPGGFRLSITFMDSSHVVGTQGGSTPFLYTSFAGGNGTLLGTASLATSDERPMSFAVVGGIPLLAAISTGDNHVSVYDMTVPTQPVLVAQANATTGALATDAHITGAVAWGKVTGTTATLYAMATDDGIQAFTVSVPAPVPAAITNQPQSQTVMELASVTFSVGASGLPAPTFQWYLGSGAIPGATNATYTIASTDYTNNGAQFHVVVQNVISNTIYSVSSAAASLTVIADINPPVLTGAQALGLTQVQVEFSEPITATSATNLSNYRITSTNGNPTILSAALDASQTNVILSVSTLVDGAFYTITLNNLAARTAAGTLIAANSQTNFIASPYQPLAIGNAAIPGMIFGITNGLGMTSGGADIGGTNDQFFFGYQTLTGDFDLSVKLTGLELSDPFAKAGLMARETLDPTGRFAATLATPAMMGVFFAARDPAGSAASLQGRFAANYPNTWLRLKRSGNSFSGFGSYDGRVWSQLGSATISMPSQIYVGPAVSSHNTNQLTVAQFLQITNVPASATVAVVENPNEPLGICSRLTPMVISEIMYNPAPRSDALRLEYVELYNSNPWFQDLSGYRLLGTTLNYTFPPGTTLPGGGFVVVAAAPADLENVYGITNILGPYGGSLKKSDTLQLLDEAGAIVLTIPYSNVSPWPVAADGTGHSLVLSRPTYGEGDPHAWDISDIMGGSPGAMESFRPSPLRDVVINEILAHSENSANPQFVELYNHSTGTNDLSGCILTDDPSTNKFLVPQGTLIGPGEFVSFTASQMGFALNATGGTLYLIKPDGSRVLDAVPFQPQANGVSYGRYPDGASEFYPLATTTPSSSNSQILIGDIVLNELMYDPISGNDDDQFIELYNKGTNTISLANWQFKSGVSFVFPGNAIIPPNNYLVVARNQANLLSKYPNLSAANTLGNYSGKLSHKGERLALSMPQRFIVTGPNGMTTTSTVYVVEDEVTYGAGGNWGQWAHGGGSSLELINPNTNHRLAYNWSDSDETSKSTWTNLEFTGILDLGGNFNNSPINLVQVGLLDVGECLVDNLEARPGGPDGTNIIANGDFEAGMANWTPQGDHLRSGLETTPGLGGYLSSQSLHLRSSDGMWTLADSVQGVLTQTSLTAGQVATLRLKARWLHGWPEVLMRLRGNWLEVTGSMPVPQNLGTPGLPNSRYQASPAAAIYQVSHSPALPQAGQPLVVSARIHNIGSFQPSVLYRIDTAVNPQPSYTSVPMNDNGTGGDALAGDGIYTATIPAQPAGTVVAFLVKVTNAPGVTSIFPQDLTNNARLPRECVVAFGDPIPTGSFSHHHVFITQNWAQRWAQWGGVSHEYYEGTWVDGGGRIVYNWLGRYAGSPYHQYTGSPVTTVGGMHWVMPDDNQVFGTTTFNKEHVPGNTPLDDDTLQREQASFWMARQLGLPVLNRRYYFYFVNGNRHAPLMEDTQVPGAEMLKEYWPNDNNGVLYKNNAWFEGDVALQPSGYMNVNNMSFCLLGRFTTTINGVPNQYKLARYRWMWWIRQFPNSADDFSELYALIDAANTPTNSTAYYANMESQVDTEEWLRLSAVEHATGDLDSFFTLVHWNMYTYKPTFGKWTALKWDWNITLGAGTSPGWGPGGANLFTFTTSAPGQYGGYDPLMTVFHSYPPYRRAFLRGFEDVANLAMNNTRINPILDAKYSAFVANGLTATSYNGLIVKDPAAPGGLESWIGTMHNSLMVALANQGVFTVSFTITSSVVSNNVVTVTGTAPVAVKTIWFNGVEWPVTWPTVMSWRVTVPLTHGTNQFSVAGVDLHGQPVTGASNSVSVVYAGEAASPQGHVVVNEIMYQPAVAGADYIELYNNSPTTTFDLSGWQLSELGYTFPTGSELGPNSYLVLAGNRSMFSSAYGGTMALFDTYPGTLSKSVQRLTLIAPGTNGSAGVVVTEVQYSNQEPWPQAANLPGSSLQLIDALQDNWRVGNWAASPVTNQNAPLGFSAATPATVNGDAASLPSFPPIWINEVEADNVTGITDSAGQHAGWLELYNPTTNVVDLSGLSLSTNYSNLIGWSFPNGAVINPFEFKVIFADAQTNLSSFSELHTGFTLGSGAGSLALSRIYNGQSQVLDYIDYTNLAPDHSYGSMPDGQSFDRQEFILATPGQPNNATNPPSFISYSTVGGVYSQDFDSLPNPGPSSVNSANPVTIGQAVYALGNPFDFAAPTKATGSGGLGLLEMSGWYGLASLVAKFGATDGDQTTGGVISFGVPNDPNRALGLLATSSTGPTAFGARLINETGRGLNYINLQFTGELWRQSNLPKSLQFFYAIDPGGSATFPASPTAYVPGLNVSFGTSASAVGGVAVDGTDPQNQTNLAVVSQLIPNWPPGGALWLVWEMMDSTGKSQGLAIDDLLFSASDLPMGPLSSTLTAGISQTNVILGWPSVSGQLYEIEYKDDLGVATWTPLGAPILGSGAPILMTNNPALPTQRFYRLRALAN